MKQKVTALVGLICAGLLINLPSLAQPSAKISSQEALTLATATFVYGYPFVQCEDFLINLPKAG
jgi:hypothetical protein